MKEYEEGTLIKFSDGKEFIVTNLAEHEGKTYLCLATNKDPLEIIFAEVNDNGDFRVITESEEKQQILPLFATKDQ